MNKLIFPVFIGAFSGFIAFFYWALNDAPTDTMPFGPICSVLVVLPALGGALVGFVIGTLVNAIFGKRGTSENNMILISSVVTAIFIGVIAFILF